MWEVKRLSQTIYVVTKYHVGQRCATRGPREFSNSFNLGSFYRNGVKLFSDLMHLARAVNFGKHCLSCNGSRSYCTGKHCCVANFTLEEMRITRNSNSSSPSLLRSNNNECNEFRS